MADESKIAENGRYEARQIVWYGWEVHEIACEGERIAIVPNYATAIRIVDLLAHAERRWATAGAQPTDADDGSARCTATYRRPDCDGVGYCRVHNPGGAVD